MMTCREIATLVASGELGAESLIRRFRVRMHLAMCRHCRGFRNQIVQLDRGLRDALTDVERDMPADLPERVAKKMTDSRL